MPAIISLEGLYTPGPPETRNLAFLVVDYNGNTYKWQVYVPLSVGNFAEYFEIIRPSIEAEIDAREAEWAALDPKTRDVLDPLSGQTITVDILKEEIVKPDVPDYYARRRMEYPSATDQLDAIWKGPSSSNYAAIEAEIAEVKARHPKVYKTAEEFQADLIETVIQQTQKRLDSFARTRNYDGILSACTYENSPVVKFQQEGQYCVQMRALTWEALYNILNEVQSGTRPVPQSFADIEPELPSLIWPN